MKLPVCFACFFGGLLAGIPVLAQPAAVAGHVTPRAAATITAKTERIAPDKTKLSIKPELKGGANFKLLDAAGKEIPATISRDGVLEAVVDPARQYLLTQLATKRPLPVDGLQFPARYVSFAKNGAANLGGLFLRAARLPLTWDDKAGAYATELVLGYEFQDGAERVLATPKTVTLFAEGSNAKIVADTIVIERSGGSGYKRVVLSTAEFADETHFTARASPMDEIKSSVSVHREAGALKLALPSTELAAFGVGSGTLTVSLLARDGFPMDAYKPLEVQLSSRRLRLPAIAVLPAGKSTAEVSFRTAGFGADEISAQSGVLRTTQLVRMIFPVAA